MEGQRKKNLVSGNLGLRIYPKALRQPYLRSGPASGLRNRWQSPGLGLRELGRDQKGNSTRWSRLIQMEGRAEPKLWRATVASKQAPTGMDILHNFGQQDRPRVVNARVLNPGVALRPFLAEGAVVEFQLANHFIRAF